jgi:hypothetical protein
MTPSVSTCGMPFTVTMMMTRSSMPGAPGARRNRVCRGERLLSVNASSNPLRPVALTVTCTDVSASISGLGTGTATTGPASSVR